MHCSVCVHTTGDAGFKYCRVMMKHGRTEAVHEEPKEVRSLCLLRFVSASLWCVLHALLHAGGGGAEGI